MEIQEQKINYWKIVCIVFIILFFGLLFFYFIGLDRNSKKEVPIIPIIQPSLQSVSNNQLFSGKVTKINEDLGLISTESGSIERQSLTNNYFEAGIYLTGPYKGGKRIIGINNLNETILGPFNFFATLDDKNYILDCSDYSSNETSFSAISSCDSYINFDRIFRIEKLIKGFGFPQVIKLDTNFSLFRKEPYGVIENEKNDLTYEISPIVDFAKLTELASKTPNLKFYQYPLSQTDRESTDEYAKQKFEHIITDNINIIVTDNTGLSFVYSLGFDNNSNLIFNKNDISSQLPLYESYGDDKGSTKRPLTPEIVNVEVSDLQSIGSVKGVDLFSLKEQVNLFNAYIKAYRDRGFGNTPKDPLVYYSKHPTLFFKDYWQRWIVIYENEEGRGQPLTF